MKYFLLFGTVFILFSCDDEPDLTRNSPEVCDDERPNQTFNPANVPTTNGNAVYCDSDSDCAEGLNGRCVGQRGLVTTMNALTMMIVEVTKPAVVGKIDMKTFRLQGPTRIHA